jgi:hypothetical protein
VAGIRYAGVEIRLVVEVITPGGEIEMASTYGVFIGSRSCGSIS